jgi:peroxiredoxin
MMKRISSILPALVAGTVLVAGSLAMAQQQAATQQPSAAPPQNRTIAHTNLKVGDMAPDFTLPDNTGKQVKLSDFRGKKSVILAFYVLAFTGGWTKELQGYQAGIDNKKIDLNDTAVFGISIDAPPSNGAFAKQIGVSFPLLSDMKRDVSKAYGILNDQNFFANRTTFVVDREGKIQHIVEGGSAISPDSAIDMCTSLKPKEVGK